jgi:hypothetical protein
MRLAMMLVAILPLRAGFRANGITTSVIIKFAKGKESLS